KIICIEYVMMKHVKKVHEAYPSATIWHNDTKKIEGTTNVEDAGLSGGSPENNDGAGLNWLLYTAPARALMRVKNVASELGAEATISACVCSAYVYTLTTPGDAAVYRIFKPWEEGTQTAADCESPGCSFNDWACDDNEWTTAGCNSADDEGSDNSGDGTGADRKATAEDTETIDADDSWYGWSISSALAQAWYDETANENGVALAGVGTVYAACYSTEHDGDQPFWVFTYTTGEPEAAGAIIFINQ
ncbi:unnamed protein product, partial [marine sediment metagenome]